MQKLFAVCSCLEVTSAKKLAHDVASCSMELFFSLFDRNASKTILWKFVKYDVKIILKLIINSFNLFVCKRKVKLVVSILFSLV